jgi:DNA-binding GntR family transcriptional regulator
LISYAGLNEEVARRLRDQILSGELADGQRIVERDVAESFGVSRGPIREALRQLELEGLVVVLPRRGARVASMTREDAEEILALRAAVEPLAVRFLLKVADEAAFAQLEECIDRLQVAADAGDWPSVVLLDMEFHGLLYSLSGKRRLQRVWDQMRVPLLQTFRLHRRFYGAIGDVPVRHAALLATLRQARARTVADAVAAHVLEFAEELLGSMDDDGAASNRTAVSDASRSPDGSVRKPVQQLADGRHKQASRSDHQPADRNRPS